MSLPYQNRLQSSKNVYGSYYNKGSITNLRNINTALALKNKPDRVYGNSTFHQTLSNLHRFSSNFSATSLPKVQKAELNSNNKGSSAFASLKAPNKIYSSKPQSSSQNQLSLKDCTTSKRASSVSNVSKELKPSKKSTLVNEINGNRYIDPDSINSLLERSKCLVYNHGIRLLSHSCGLHYPESIEYFEKQERTYPSEYTLENRSSVYKEGYLARLKARQAKNQLRNLPDNFKKYSFVRIYAGKQKLRDFNSKQTTPSGKENAPSGDDPVFKEMIRSKTESELELEKKLKRSIFEDLESVKTNVRIMPPIQEMTEEEFTVFKHENRESYKHFMKLFSLAKLKLTDENSNRVFSEIIDDMNLSDRDGEKQLSFIAALKKLFEKLRARIGDISDKEQESYANGLIENIRNIDGESAKTKNVEEDEVEGIINILERYDTNLSKFNSYMSQIDSDEKVENPEFMELYERHKKLDEQFAKDKFEFDLETIVEKK